MKRGPLRNMSKEILSMSEYKIRFLAVHFWVLTIDVEVPSVLNLRGRHNRILRTASQNFAHVAHLGLEPQSARSYITTVRGLQKEAKKHQKKPTHTGII